MARVFVDVGAHVGETLSVVLDPRWGFDRIHCFEPAPDCWPVLRELADDRVEILPFGLWTGDERRMLHDPGKVGASLFSGKEVSDSVVEVELRDAAAWFAEHLDPADEIVVKINCEGAECDLLDHLLAAGQLAGVDELVVHFDVRKIPSLRHREAETRSRLDAAGVRYRPADDIFFGGNIPDKTANWLSWYFAEGPARWRYSVLRRAEFAVRVPLYRLRQRLRPRRSGG